MSTIINIIYPNDKKLISVYPETAQISEQFFLISYVNEKFEITNIEADSNENKFDITCTRITNPSEILQAKMGKSTDPRPAYGTELIKDMKAAWRIDTNTHLKNIENDLMKNNRANFNFRVRTNDESFDNFDISLQFALKSYVTA